MATTIVERSAIERKPKRAKKEKLVAKQHEALVNNIMKLKNPKRL
jgi:hypothetical protein